MIVRRYTLTGDQLRWKRWGVIGRTLILKQVISIEVETNDHGPFAEDHFWVLNTNTGRYRFSTASKFASNLLDWMLALPEFDTGLFIEMSTCVEKRREIVWNAKS